MPFLLLSFFSLYLRISFWCTMKVFEANEKNISTASHIIKGGGLVAFPTETVYGLGANGLNATAVAKIFEAKNRPTFNPLILHIADKNHLEDISVVVNHIVYKLIEVFWPGPLTLVLPKKEKVPEIVTSGNPTVAVRMPDHRVALSLIEKAGIPIAAPSANIFGQLSPTTAAHVEASLKDKIDMILDGGGCRVGLESTILQVEESKFTLLRPGGVPVEKIEEYTGIIEKKEIISDAPVSPGQLPYHYSPTQPLKFLDEVDIESVDPLKTGIIYFSEKKFDKNFSSVKVLSPTRNMYEAAANLFSHLHLLQSQKLDLILVERIERTGLGTAIMDRLQRAAAKYR